MRRGEGRKGKGKGKEKGKKGKERERKGKGRERKRKRKRRRKERGKGKGEKGDRGNTSMYSLVWGSFLCSRTDNEPLFLGEKLLLIILFNKRMWTKKGGSEY